MLNTSSFLFLILNIHMNQVTCGYFYEINTKYDKSRSLVKQICSELDANYNI